MAERRSSDVARWAASVGRRAQSYAPDHPRFLEAKRNLDFAKATERLAQVVDTWGAPSEEQRNAVAQLLGSS